MSTAVHIVDHAIIFRAGMSIDADGCPRAYKLDDTGLDWLANARDGNDWIGVVTDNGKRTGNPVEQGPNDPYPGYLISPTALCDARYDRTDPRRYVDAEQVPYVSVPSDFGSLVLGDLCMVLYADKRCAAIVCDIGPHRRFGEGSIALAAALGIPSSPRHGGVGDGVTYIIFAGSASIPPWPRAIEEFSAHAWGLFAYWGGTDKLSTVPA
jgi:hypothetical protein